MITTRIIYLDTNGMQWQISHLFEHIIITKFLEYLRRADINPALFGWINGDSFEERIYVEAYFYHHSAADIFDRFFNNIPEFSTEEIDQAIRVIETEGRVSMVKNDLAKLQEELAVLSQTQWNIELPSSPARDVAILSEQKSLDVPNYTVVFYFSKLTEIERKLVLRLRIILIDIVTLALREELDAYQGGVSITTAEKDEMLFSVQSSIKDTTPAIVKKVAVNSLESVDFEKEATLIAAHMNFFRKSPSCSSLPIEYYRETGITTTNNEIAMLAKTATIDSIVSKLTIVTRNATELDDELCS